MEDESSLEELKSRVLSLTEEVEELRQRCAAYDSLAERLCKLEGVRTMEPLKSRSKSEPSLHTTRSLSTKSLSTRALSTDTLGEMSPMKLSFHVGKGLFALGRISLTRGVRAISLSSGKGAKSSRQAPAEPEVSASCEVEIQMSLWDASLFAFTEHLGPFSSLNLSALLLLCALSQILFCVLLWRSDLTISSYDNDVVEGFRLWRKNVGHSFDSFDQNQQLSLTYRVCQGSVLSSSATISEQYHEVDEYLSSFLGMKQGVIMCVLALLAWYSKLAVEVAQIYKWSRGLATLRVGEKTVMVNEGSSGKMDLWFMQISNERLVICILVICLRVAVVILLALCGTLFLVYEVNLGDLLLNAVALELVISTDELLMEAFCFDHVKLLISSTRPFVVPRKQRRDYDLVSTCLQMGVVVVLIIVTSVYISPQNSTLEDVRSAICGGDQMFVYTVGGGGVVRWSHPNVSELSTPLVTDFPWKPSEEHTSFRDLVIERVLQGLGRGECPSYECFSNETIAALIEGARPECCSVKEAFLPDVTGAGWYTLEAKRREDAESGTRDLNPACYDMLDMEAFVYNDIQNAVADALRNSIDYTPCGGSCPFGERLCENGQCKPFTCADILPFCSLNSAAGVRARQFCPVACGCASPFSSSSVFSLDPMDGCPRSCRTTSHFRREMKTAPCEDVSRTDPLFIEYLDTWAKLSVSWPKSLSDSSAVILLSFRRYGCSFLSMSSTPADWPYDFGFIPSSVSGENPCIENGYWFPFKPFSLFCPVTCRCRAGDEFCADTCPTPNRSEDGTRVDRTGLAPPLSFAEFRLDGSLYLH